MNLKKNTKYESTEYKIAIFIIVTCVKFDFKILLYPLN